VSQKRKNPLRITEWEWQAESGIYSHTMTQVIRRRGSLVGLLVSYSPARGAQIDWSLGAARPQIAADRWARLAELRPLSNFLFPAIPDDAYYVKNLVVDPTARGHGLARQLMEHAFAAGRAEGCRSCHLDVASTNPAVDFYHAQGMHAAVETVVPALQRRGIPSHYRMVRRLEPTAPNPSPRQIGDARRRLGTHHHRRPLKPNIDRRHALMHPLENGSTALLVGTRCFPPRISGD
jgi:ribosomal protein S18 acetylase RimI-like enzyme